jgi:hypothetical protein
MGAGELMPLDSRTLAEREQRRARLFRRQVAAMTIGGAVTVLAAYAGMWIMWRMQ